MYDPFAASLASHITVPGRVGYLIRDACKYSSGELRVHITSDASTSPRWTMLARADETPVLRGIGINHIHSSRSAGDENWFETFLEAICSKAI